MKHKHSEEDRAYGCDTNDDNDDDTYDIVKENNESSLKDMAVFGISVVKYGPFLSIYTKTRHNNSGEQAKILLYILPSVV